MKRKDEKKKSRFARRIKREAVTALQFFGVFALIYAVPFLFRSKPVVVAGYKTISFQSLGGFDPDQLHSRLENSVDPTPVLPAKVKALAGKKVAITGYMIPFETDGDGVIKTFALVRDQASCCFGGSPKLNEWVFVTMRPNTKAKFYGYSPVVVSGTLTVGADKTTFGGWDLYRLAGDRVMKI